MKLSRHQKVYCTYHFTRWFKPPMCGKIILKHPVRKKHLFSRIHNKGEKDGKCFWYFVKMTNGLIVLMPETCIEDLNKSIEEDNEYLSNLSDLNDEGNIKAWLRLQEQQAEKLLFKIKK